MNSWRNGLQIRLTLGPGLLFTSEILTNKEDKQFSRTLSSLLSGTLPSHFLPIAENNKTLVKRDWKEFMPMRGSMGTALEEERRYKSENN